MKQHTIIAWVADAKINKPITVLDAQQLLNSRSECDRNVHHSHNLNIIAHMCDAGVMPRANHEVRKQRTLQVSKKYIDSRIDAVIKYAVKRRGF